MIKGFFSLPVTSFEKMTNNFWFCDALGPAMESFSHSYRTKPSGYIIWDKCPFTQENSYFLIIKTQSWRFGHFYSKIAIIYGKIDNLVHIVIYSNMKKTWLKVFSTSRWPLLKKWPIIFDFETLWGQRWNLFPTHTEVSQVVILYGVSARLPRKICNFS